MSQQQSQESILESWNHVKIPKNSESRRKIHSCDLSGSTVISLLYKIKQPVSTEGRVAAYYL